MKRPSPLIRHRVASTDLDAAMTPMIDVVFLLLVFFVWTVSFQVVEQILPSQMSSQLGDQPSEMQEPPPEADFENLVVHIGWDGQQPLWSLNEQPLASSDALRQRLMVVSAIKEDAPVILHPDGQVPLGYVIQAYDWSKQAGFQKVSFAVNPVTQAPKPDRGPSSN